MTYRITKVALIGLPLLVLLLACDGEDLRYTPTRPHTPTVRVLTSGETRSPSSPTVSPDATATETDQPITLPAPTPFPSITPTQPAWFTLWPGVGERYIRLDVPDAEGQSYIYALRLDPARVVFRVHYDQEQPHSIEEWQTMTGAAIIVNGGFFSSNHTPVGRIIVDGDLYGYPLALDYGDDSVGVPGLFAVLDDRVSIYAIGRSSFSPRGLRFDQAIESYPLLLLPGGQPTFPVETDMRARRTVIGLDEQGHVIILLSNDPLLSLHELANWLAASDLCLDSALNLDGGRSSGLIVNLRDKTKYLPAYVPLPIVIGIYVRGE